VKSLALISLLLLAFQKDTPPLDNQPAGTLLTGTVVDALTGQPIAAAGGRGVSRGEARGMEMTLAVVLGVLAVAWRLAPFSLRQKEGETAFGRPLREGEGPWSLDVYRAHSTDGSWISVTSRILLLPMTARLPGINTLRAS
jgi:hypothetical protein